ncbi:hypothetical protein [Deinococcus yunweiensis]|uniref:hypothetical protein n=1 Tax=Deinococcus yunweiensis TaxID=367282 RepID=UPI00398F66BC
MSQVPQIHHYTIHLMPTGAQAEALRHLGWVAALTRDLAHEQAERAVRGEDVSLSGLLHSFWDHRDRSVAGEARRLQQVGATQGAPLGLLEYAVVAGRRTFTTRLRRRGIEEGAAVAGEGLITPATRDGVSIAGVGADVRADIGALPRWARAVWQLAVDVEPELPALRLVGASLTGFGFVEQDDHDAWTLDVALRWDVYPVHLLESRWEDELSLERRAVSDLMGWAPDI